MRKMVVQGSFVLIKKLGVIGEGSLRGEVMAVGTTSTIALKVNDIVYYGEDKIEATINHQNEILHIVTHYKVFAKEVNVISEEETYQGFEDLNM